MADYDWFDDSPTDAEIEAEEWRPKGFTPVFNKDRVTISGHYLYIEYFLCLRGCGCVVWNPAAHIKNVCTEFNPVVVQ